MDCDRSCRGAGCKTAIRRMRRRRRARTQPEGQPTAEPSEATPDEDRMWDVMPTGYDPQGNEVSFTNFLRTRLPDDCPYDPMDFEACIRTHGQAILTKFEEQAIGLFEEYCDYYEKAVPIADQLEFHTTPDPDFYKIEEHVSGPTCCASRVAKAYSGYQLSFEEMKACTTVQCLGPKNDSFMLACERAWKPSLDDEEFESTSNYCLSGLGDRPGSIEEASPCYPCRHGKKYISPTDIGGFSRGSLPFHPYCLEVYKRVSLLHKGNIGITALARKVKRGLRWQPPSHPAVRSGQEQWWEHECGSEFLVANPVHIPALREILERAIQAEDDFVIRDRLSNLSVTTPEHKGRKDVFATLPQELRDSIANHLSYDDIAALRLASSSFHHLQNSLWHRLIREDMPWLWEAWCDLPYSFWACTTMQELMAHDKPLFATSETLKGLPEEQRRKLRTKNSRARKKHRRPRPAQRLDPLRTDWHWVYCQLKREFGNIKGLQNRERIWHALAHVMQGTAESKEVLEKLHADYKKANGMR